MSVFDDKRLNEANEAVQSGQAGAGQQLNQVLSDHGIVYPSAESRAAAITAAGGVVPSGGGKNSSSSYDLSDSIKQQAAASLTAELAGLKGAYEKSMLGYDAAEKKLPATYQQAKNQAAAQNAQEKRAFDERAVAAGMSSGTNAQAQLAMSSVYQSKLAGLDRQQAEATDAIQLQKAQLKSEYESAILAARAKGNAQLASDLYKEMLRLQGIEREDEQLQAEWDREDELTKAKWDREDEQTAKKDKDAERDYARQLALAYELVKPEDIGKINSLDDLAAYTAVAATPAGDTPAGAPRGTGFDNGSLTAEQVRLMQKHYGLSADGMWGPNSQKTTGMSADQAWAAYQQAISPSVDVALNNLYQRIAGYIESGSKTPAEIATMLDKSALSDEQKGELLTMMGY